MWFLLETTRDHWVQLKCWQCSAKSWEDIRSNLPWCHKDNFLDAIHFLWAPFRNLRRLFKGLVMNIDGYVYRKNIALIDLLSRENAWNCSPGFKSYSEQSFFFFFCQEWAIAILITARLHWSVKISEGLKCKRIFSALLEQIRTEFTSSGLWVFFLHFIFMAVFF